MFIWKIFLILFSLKLFAEVPLEWIQFHDQDANVNEQKSLYLDKGHNRFQSLWNQKLLWFQRSMNNLTDSIELKGRDFYLGRIDLAIGIGLGGEIGIASSSVESGVEILWERPMPELDSVPSSNISNQSDHDIVVDPSVGPDDVYQSMIRHVKRVVQLERIRPRIRRKMVRILKRDATRISKAVLNMSTMPRVGDWYVSGFFKNYYFGHSFGLSDIFTIGTDTRLRFRFKFDQIPHQIQSKRELNLAQKYMRKVMCELNKNTQFESPWQQFELARVWSIHQLSTSFDLKLWSVSKGKAVQVVYERVPKDLRLHAPGVSLDEYDKCPGKNPLRKMKKGFEFSYALMNATELSSAAAIYPNKNRINSNNDSFSISQVRIPLAVSSELDFVIASIEKSKTFDFHFKRKD